METTETRPVVSEFLGTLLLVFFAVGSAVLAGEYIGSFGIALTFGFVMLALVYALGPISGCHINPSVTLGALLAKRITVRTAVEYWIAQVLGGIVGAALLFLVAKQVPGLQTHAAFGSNGWGDRSAVHINLGGAFVAEIVMTFLFVFVVLGATHNKAVKGFAGLAIGLALATVHLIGVPLDGTGVNPARSIGPALFAGGAAITQLWLFIVAPLIGGALAAVVHQVTHPPQEEAAPEKAAPGESAPDEPAPGDRV
ncbi:MIP family channel protein [Streptomyces sp. CT34]|uniref:MIP family channel protein n=1 Tax=Streptomyces sp. CT34 TaxID=1553907 RepID=UPI0005B842A4|nr:MIP family channel protein [Streptomyces sp. CT34]